MRKKILVIAALAILFGGLIAFGASCLFHTRNHIAVMQAPIEAEKAIIKYGMNLSGFTVLTHVVKPNEFFSDILSQYNVTSQKINSLALESKEIFNLKKIKAGSMCTFLCAKNDSTHAPQKLIIEENKVDYVIFNLSDSLYIQRGQNQVEHKHQEISGIINSSLYETLERNNLNPQLAVRLSEIFAWTVDFYKIQPGDKFKLIYDEDFVNGQSVSIGQINACVFNSGGKDFYAFYYQKPGTKDGEYYDENGNSMHKQFLKAPVKFSRISSGYSLNRFHPVTKEWKAHLGTDYAAPSGTPILATADGIVEDACFKQFNGNYVKIRHNGEYKTQYLHMSKIGAGIHPGARVKQGEVIGYVGMTGLATGPHVCYRFWKDGEQVDPRKQKLTFSDPMPAKCKNDFLIKTKDAKKAIDAIVYQQPKSEPVAKHPAQVEDDFSSNTLVHEFF